MTCGCRGWVSQSGYFLGPTFEVAPAKWPFFSEAMITIPRIYLHEVSELLGPKAAGKRCDFKNWPSLWFTATKVLLLRGLIDVSPPGFLSDPLQCGDQGAANVAPYRATLIHQVGQCGFNTLQVCQLGSHIHQLPLSLRPRFVAV